MHVLSIRLIKMQINGLNLTLNLLKIQDYHHEEVIKMPTDCICMWRWKEFYVEDFPREFI